MFANGRDHLSCCRGVRRLGVTVKLHNYNINHRVAPLHITFISYSVLLCFALPPSSSKQFHRHHPSSAKQQQVPYQIGHLKRKQVKIQTRSLHYKKISINRFVAYVTMGRYSLSLSSNGNHLLRKNLIQ